MIREMEKRDIYASVELVRTNWGKEPADRFLNEVLTAFYGGQHPYAYRWPPRYYVYENDEGQIVAFAGMMWSWVMHGVMDFIWINVHPDYQGMGIGEKLTKHRISVAQSDDTKLIQLMTQKPTFFERFGFETGKVIDGWNYMTLQLGKLEI